VDAVKKGDAQAIRSLLKDPRQINAQAVDGSTALQWAVHRDDLATTDLLLRSGADVKLANRYGVTALSLAAVNGNVAILERLLAAGADPNTTLPGGETVLMTAARTGKADAVHRLIRRGANVNARETSTGQTALMWAAHRNNAEAVKALLEVETDLDARTEKAAPAGAAMAGGQSTFAAPAPTGFSALMFAARAGALDAVRVLLEAGADINQTLSDGQNVLVVATANAHWQLADLLLDKGADPNADQAGWSALHQVVRTRRPNIGFGTPGPIPTGTLDSINVIKKMIAKGANVNLRMSRNGMKDGQRNRLNRLGATPFFLAAKNTDVEVMKVLAAAGADANIRNADNTTPLMVAAGLAIWNPGEDGGSLPGQEPEVLEAVKMCVELGNDVNAANDAGETALHGVGFRGVNMVVEYLVERGARLDARDKRGWTPLMIANGLSYSDFYKEQRHTAELMARLMKERGIPTENSRIEASVCFDCLQTHGDQSRNVAERDRRMEAEFVKNRAQQQ
jgi:ankyrin repeat protein